MTNCPYDINNLLSFPDFVVTSIEHTEDGEIILHGHCTKEEIMCPHCKCLNTGPHTGKDKVIKHLDLWQSPCYLAFRHYTYLCHDCGECFLRPLSFLSISKHYTDDFVEYLVELARGCSIDHASSVLEIPYSNAERVYYAYLVQQDEKKTPWQAKHIGIDEIAMKKGHKDYVLIIYDLDNGIVLDVLADRKKETLNRYLQQLPQETKDSIESICIDMWKPYRQCLEKLFPRKIVVVDRFHVAKELNKACDKVRKELNDKGEFAQLSGKERKKLHWAVRFNNKSLRKKQQYRKVLRKAMKVSPQLKLAVELRNKFREIFNLKRFEVAQRSISNWLRRVTRSKIAPLIDFLKTFRNWRPWIMNFFKFRYSNGPAEGLNNKIKLIKRLGFGFRSVKNFRLRILHTCGELL